VVLILKKESPGAAFIFMVDLFSQAPEIPLLYIGGQDSE
jgi:hypothetical protein